MNTFRRRYLDLLLGSTRFSGKVLDVGGKKDNKRGGFRPPVDRVDCWEYLNIDPSTRPDYCCSAEAVPVEENRYDCILMTEVLEHLENPLKVLEECSRILRPGGVLIATMPFLFPIHADPYDFQRWTPHRIRLEFRQVGLSVRRTAPMGSVFAVIHDILCVSFGTASKNRQSLLNRLTARLVMPVLGKLFMWLDGLCAYQSRWITTGFYIEAEKVLVHTDKSLTMEQPK